MDKISIKDAIKIANYLGGSKEEMCCIICKNIVVEPPNKICENCKQNDSRKKMSTKEQIEKIEEIQNLLIF